MEERCLLSSTTLPSAPKPATTTTQTVKTTPSPKIQTDTVQGHETTWHQVSNTVYSTTFAGSATGSIPGTFTATVQYSGNPGYGVNPIAPGGQWQGWTTGQKGKQPTYTGSFTGGSITWNPGGTQATVHATLRVQQGNSAPESGTFDGTVRSTGQGFVLTGTLKINPTPVSSTPTPTPSTPKGPTHTYTDSIQGQQTTWHKIGNDLYATLLSGTATGKVPGTFSATVQYNGTPNFGSNPVVKGGVWQVTPKGAAAALSGSFTGGSIVWNQFGTQATLTLNLSITGGSRKASGTATLVGHLTYSKGHFVLDSKLTLNLTKPL